MTPLDRLMQRTDVVTVDPDGAVAFAAGAGPGVLLLPGDPTRPEVIDLAVVMGELEGRHPGLRLAVARVGEEPALRERLPVTAFPSLVFVRDGGVAKVLSRMQSWSTYADALTMLTSETSS